MTQMQGQMSAFTMGMRSLLRPVLPFRSYAANPFLNMPNYPSFRELTEEIQSPTAISLGLGEAGTPLRARCYNCGQMGHISYDCKQPQVRKACYTCGNQGHLSRDCPQRKRVLVCYLCRQVGHVTIDCPTRYKEQNGTDASSSEPVTIE